MIFWLVWVRVLFFAICPVFLWSFYAVVEGNFISPFLPLSVGSVLFYVVCFTLSSSFHCVGNGVNRRSSCKRISNQTKPNQNKNTAPSEYRVECLECRWRHSLSIESHMLNYSGFAFWSRVANPVNTIIMLIVMVSRL